MNAHAIHAYDEDHRHIVGFGNLRVLICERHGEWFAQGVEIDYAASGRTIEEAKNRFERGLAATVALHLRKFDTIERLLTFAPESVWKRLKAPSAFDFSMVSIHEIPPSDVGIGRLPFDTIAYVPEAHSPHAITPQG